MTVYQLDINDSTRRKLDKLAKRNKVAAMSISRKLKQILDDPYRFKPLNAPHQGKRRVHIDSSFVLTYAIDEASKTVSILDYDHHDEIYK